MKDNESAEWADKCTKCGLCCHWKDDDGSIKKCKFLIRIGDKFYCRIYKNRLGTEIGTLSISKKKLYCARIIDAPTDFEECPYNSGRPLSPLKKSDVLSLGNKSNKMLKQS